MVLNNQGSKRGQPPKKEGGRKRGRINWWVLLAWLAALGILGGTLLVGAVVVYFDRQLPDFRALSEYKPALISKVYDRNGEILAEYANERRIWVPIAEVPKPVIQAFLAAEDSHFFEHGGYDLKAIVRASLVNLFTHRTQGASTITQQVAKTYLLSSERTYTRKIKELILSWRIERAFSKNEILELYLNRIYLGNGSYGVAAAAQTYFSKPLADLNLQERALIAGMPQAPTRYNPVRNPNAAKARRDIVIRRLQDENYISRKEADAAVAAPLGLKVSPLKQGEDAPHFAEYIRQQIVKQYGEPALYEDGLTIYTTLDLPTQRRAEMAVYEGLKEYDRRRGWRGPLLTLDSMADWAEQMDEISEKYSHSWRIGEPAVVLKSSKDVLRVGLVGGLEGVVPASTMKWAKRVPTQFKRGEVILVKAMSAPTEGKASTLPKYSLEQLPDVQGALVALDVASGEVLAMVGGLGEGVGFNRAVMAKRQLGSAFKPLVYTAALEQGYTPASTVLDAPIVFRMGDTEWKPHNYDDKIGGLTTLRTGLEKSKNLMTVRLAQDVGMRKVADVAKRLGITDQVPIVDLSVALGTVDMNLLEMTSAYSVFPRQGLYVGPTFMRRVQDAQGVTLFRAHPACTNCLAQMGAREDELPALPDQVSQRALSPQVAYLMTSMLEGVVQRGTAASLRTLGRPIAGKTGTTNDYIDAWFIGYTPSLAVGVWVGFDTPKTLGHGETGGKTAVPIWKKFAAAQLEEGPLEDFEVPSGIEFVRIDGESGYLPGENTKKVMTEAFIAGTAPSQTTPAFVDDPTYDPGNTGGGTLQNLLQSFGIY